MELINLTPHAINIYSKDSVKESKGSYTVIGDADPMITYQPSGKVARAFMNSHLAGHIGEREIPVYQCSYGEPVDLPEYKEGTAYIVSSLTVSAAKSAGRTTDDLFTVFGCVRNSEGAIIGCVGLAFA